ncbi:hypothetical protein EMCG_05158 [[Emmonsia] crescens]|uniref:Uncharacterized protein n=1 Tax=[Emmonsia] crescens TaxID=73230 RepID=A0A0G2HQ61_9EURO|nr:hypothetical protein EMCG_05158 [Emmonsia crescens UAMH 3008]
MASAPPRRNRNQIEVDVQTDNFAELENFIATNLEKIRTETCQGIDRCIELLERIQLKEDAIQDIAQVSERAQDRGLLLLLEKEMEELDCLYQNTEQARDELEEINGKCNEQKLVMEGYLKKIQLRATTMAGSTNDNDPSPAKRARYDTRSNYA